jgi:trk system potassium uptake protein TrkH
MTTEERSKGKSPTLSLLKTVAFVLGSVMLFIAVAMTTAALVSAIYQEFEVAMWIAISAGITAGMGYMTRRVVRRPATISIKQGFATVGLAWFVISIFGALPYLFTEYFASANVLGEGFITEISNAIFETASGFTTTGASILSDPGELSKGIAFWRAMTQWLGGMGVIVLGVAPVVFAFPPHAVVVHVHQVLVRVEADTVDG